MAKNMWRNSTYLSTRSKLCTDQLTPWLCVDQWQQNVRTHLKLRIKCITPLSFCLETGKPLENLGNYIQVLYDVSFGNFCVYLSLSRQFSTCEKTADSDPTYMSYTSLSAAQTDNGKDSISTQLPLSVCLAGCLHEYSIIVSQTAQRWTYLKCVTDCF